MNVHQRQQRWLQKQTNNQEFYKINIICLFQCSNTLLFKGIISTMYYLSQVKILHQHISSTIYVSTSHFHKSKNSVLLVFEPMQHKQPFPTKISVTVATLQLPELSALSINGITLTLVENGCWFKHQQDRNFSKCWWRINKFSANIAKKELEMILKRHEKRVLPT